jgi:formylglycine-generating enzyme required for sulfatase activity
MKFVRDVAAAQAGGSSPGVGLPARAPAKNMVWVPDGEFQMGSSDFYPEERPVHRVTIDGFWMDEHPVTVAEFRRFVKATGHVTWAERPPEPDAYPGVDPELLVPGRLCFSRPQVRSTSPIIGTGGAGRPALSGATPKDRAARCTAVSYTR